VFDAVAARYALAAAGSVDVLALTHVDRVPALPRVACTRYESDVEGRVTDLARNPTLTEFVRRCRPVYSPVPGNGPEQFVEFIVGELGTRVGITSAGPTARDKRASPDFASR
jgi:adenylosuccinate synthase